MKVKITSCSNQSWWYANDIGKIFAVDKVFDEDDDYKVIDDKFSSCYIARENCEVVSELPNKPAGMNDKQLSLFIININNNDSHYDVEFIKININIDANQIRG